MGTSALMHPRRLGLRGCAGDLAHSGRIDDLVAFLEARLTEGGLPPRVIEALRAILAETWGGPGHQDMWEHHIRLLGAVWRDHPDYRPEWKP